MADKKKEEEAVEVAEKAFKPDETVPGGSYIVNDVTVNCEGKPLDKDGNVVVEEKK